MIMTVEIACCSFYILSFSNNNIIAVVIAMDIRSKLLSPKIPNEDSLFEYSQKFVGKTT